MSEAIADLLSELRAPGSFATRLRASTADLDIEVNLRLTGASSPSEVMADARLLAELRERIASHFETAVPHPYLPREPRAPRRLVYLLDHEYTERSLSWDPLKGADRLRVSSLRAVTVTERFARAARLSPCTRGHGPRCACPPARHGRHAARHGRHAARLGRSLRRRAKRALGLRSVADAHTGAVVAVQRTDSALGQLELPLS